MPINVFRFLISAMHQIVFILLVLLTTANAYTLRYGEDVRFPKQYASEDHNDRTFRRQDYVDYVQVLHCPLRYRFDSSVGKCVKDLEATVTRYCPGGDFRGVVAYPLNCRKFVNCWENMERVQKCSLHLVFDVQRKECNYPEIAGCCEYRAKTTTGSKS